MTRAFYIFTPFVCIALFGCDRALDDRYEGLVVVPIQEVTVTDSTLPEVGIVPIDTLVEVDIPRARPDIMPLRELTPNEANATAAEGATAARLATNALIEAQDAEAKARAEYLETQTNLNEILGQDQPLSIDIVPIADDETDADLAVAIDLDTKEPLSFDDTRFSDDPIISGLPPARPAPFSQSFDQLDTFLAEQTERERLKAEEEKTIEEARQAQEAAAAERLANLEQVSDNPVGTSRLIRADAISLPLSYSNAAPIESLQDLQTLFDEANYNLAHLISGQPAPALILQRLPKGLVDLRQTTPPLQQELFIKSILPLCLVTNARIQEERDYILSIDETTSSLNQSSDPVIRGLSAKYQAKTYDDLLTKAQTIPVSLCLAYSILASDWGTNAAALEQNALFGTWVKKPENEIQIFPASIVNDESARSVLFPSLQTAADAFALFINRHSSFERFREERNRNTLQDNLLSGTVAAEYVSDLNPTDTALISNLIQTIRDNQLGQFNLVRLQDGSRQAVPVL